jgi:hypothetical protein
MRGNHIISKHKYIPIGDLEELLANNPCRGSDQGMGNFPERRLMGTNPISERLFLGQNFHSH